jgi:L-Ala-D/L-Glu epimerase
LVAPFVVSRGSRTDFETLRVTLEADGFRGQGESSGLYYKGETVEGMQRQIEKFVSSVDGSFDANDLLAAMLPNGARAALDAAWWDWKAKASGRPVWQLAGLRKPQALRTAVTISKGSPQAMAQAAAKWAEFGMLKLKVGGDADLALDLARVAAVRRHVGPTVDFIVDPNTAWSADEVARADRELHEMGVRLLEQPVAPGSEGGLCADKLTLSVCADEAVNDRSDLVSLHPLYSVINIKLCKSGGLTEALALRRDAEARGLDVMVGCMSATSLGLAPAVLVAQGAVYVDLDAHLELIRDRQPPLQQEGDWVHPPSAALWG